MVDDMLGCVGGHMLLNMHLGNMLDLMMDLVSNMMDHGGGGNNRSSVSHGDRSDRSHGNWGLNLGDHWCVRGLGAPVKEKWGSWRCNDPAVTSQGEQVGGWTVSYDVGGELRFITIKGAGHMAPQWRPLATTTMFARFLQGEAFTKSSVVV